MSEGFNLSDKWIKSFIEGDKRYYLEEDVKKFIEILKNWIRTTESEEMWRTIMMKIDDLAGDKLI